MFGQSRAATHQAMGDAGKCRRAEPLAQIGYDLRYGITKRIGDDGLRIRFFGIIPSRRKRCILRSDALDFPAEQSLSRNRVMKRREFRLVRASTRASVRAATRKSQTHLGNGIRLIAVGEGEMLRMSPAAFKRARVESPALSQLLLRYALVLVQRGAQNGACIQHHTAEERMSRWLLETAHRKGKDEFGLTQEFMSDMLGVRRQSVNLTARILQQAGLIEYRHGQLKILERAGLEQTSCECFRVTTSMYESVMRLG